MPQLGETVTEDTVTKWMKAVGDTVARDEPLFEVSTDKGDSEVPSPAAGVLTDIIVPEGDTVEVGVVLAKIGDDADGAAAPAAEAATPAPEAAAAARAPRRAGARRPAAPDRPTPTRRTTSRTTTPAGRSGSGPAIDPSCATG